MPKFDQNETIPREAVCVPNGFGICSTHAVCDYMRGVVAELQAKRNHEHEELARKFRDSLSNEIDGTQESLIRCAKMLETYAPDLYPANDKGQVHFARAMMESVASEIRAFFNPSGDKCEHGVKDGDWCEPCNKAMKKAAKENE